MDLITAAISAYGVQHKKQKPCQQSLSQQLQEANYLIKELKKVLGVTDAQIHFKFKENWATAYAYTKEGLWFSLRFNGSDRKHLHLIRRCPHCNQTFSNAGDINSLADLGFALIENENTVFGHWPADHDGQALSNDVEKAEEHY